MSFGERLRELRTERNLTLRELASRTKLNFTYLSKIENNRSGYTPSVATIRVLAQELGTDELELLHLAKKLPAELQSVAKLREGRLFLRAASRKLRTGKDWQSLLEHLERLK